MPTLPPLLPVQRGLECRLRCLRPVLLLPVGDSRDHLRRLLAVFGVVVPRRQSDEGVEVRQDVRVEDLLALDLHSEPVVRVTQGSHERTKVAESVGEEVDPERSIDSLGLNVKFCLSNVVVGAVIVAPVVALCEERPEGICKANLKCYNE
jgi:hypothetical protein